MGFFYKVLGRNMDKEQQQANSARRFGAVTRAIGAVKATANGGAETSVAKSEDHLSEMGKHYYRDPYEYMQNFLREFRETEKARKNSIGW